jgi:hypothetical protein
VDGARPAGRRWGAILSARAADQASSPTADWQAERAGPLTGARAFAVVMGGPLVLLAGAVASAALVVRALVRRERPPRLAAAGVAATAAYARVVRPWLRTWGTRPGEADKPLAGDETVPDPGVQQTRAITIDAPPDVVWPWLAQVGQDRAGFYSYRWLENLAGCRMPDVREIRPGWQDRRVGQTVPLHPSAGLKLLRFDARRALTLERWYLALEPDGPARTRLYARSRTPRGAATAGYVLLFELPHFLMERKMLLGIKQRAEHAQRQEPC